MDRLLSGYGYPFAISVALSFVARAQTIFNPMYSNDSYAFAYQQSVASSTYDLFLSQGRYVMALEV